MHARGALEVSFASGIRLIIKAWHTMQVKDIQAMNRRQTFHLVYRNHKHVHNTAHTIAIASYFSLTGTAIHDLIRNHLATHDRLLLQPLGLPRYVSHTRKPRWSAYKKATSQPQMSLLSFLGLGNNTELASLSQHVSCYNGYHFTRDPCTKLCSRTVSR